MRRLVKGLRMAEPFFRQHDVLLLSALFDGLPSTRCMGRSVFGLPPPRRTCCAKRGTQSPGRDVCLMKIMVSLAYALDLSLSLHVHLEIQRLSLLFRDHICPANLPPIIRLWSLLHIGDDIRFRASRVPSSPRQACAPRPPWHACAHSCLLFPPAASRADVSHCPCQTDP